MGQEIGVTPLQMAAAFGALANNGLRVAPHLVREIRTSTGDTLYRARPEERRVISPETATALRGMLEGVTIKGTAKKAQLDGYSAAGKTGTAEFGTAKPPHSHAWFAGYQGDLAFAVFVEGGESSKTTAVPIAAAFLRALHKS